MTKQEITISLTFRTPAFRRCGAWELFDTVDAAEMEAVFLNIICSGVWKTLALKICSGVVEPGLFH